MPGFSARHIKGAICKNYTTKNQSNSCKNIKTNYFAGLLGTGCQALYRLVYFHTLK